MFVLRLNPFATAAYKVAVAVYGVLYAHRHTLHITVYSGTESTVLAATL